MCVRISLCVYFFVFLCLPICLSICPFIPQFILPSLHPLPTQSLIWAVPCPPRLPCCFRTASAQLPRNNDVMIHFREASAPCASCYIPFREGFRCLPRAWVWLPRQQISLILNPHTHSWHDNYVIMYIKRFLPLLIWLWAPPSNTPHFQHTKNSQPYRLATSLPRTLARTLESIVVTSISGMLRAKFSSAKLVV